MVVRTENSARRALTPLPASGDLGGPAQASAAEVFTRGFLNASLLQLAICAPPRQAATRRYEQVYITELGERARQRMREQEAAAVAE